MASSLAGQDGVAAAVDIICQQLCQAALAEEMPAEGNFAKNGTSHQVDQDVWERIGYRHMIRCLETPTSCMGLLAEAAPSDKLKHDRHSH